MKPTPKGWPRISNSIYYDDPHTAIDWLCRAFGFELRMKVEGDDGTIHHSELSYGEGLVMVGGTAIIEEARASYQKDHKSPRSLGGAVTQAMCLFVDDADAHCELARAAGAKIFREPSTSDYGDDYWVDRSYGAIDPEGHHWWFMQRVREAKAPNHES